MRKLTRRSRYVRPDPPLPMQLTERDLAILADIADCGLMAAWHVRERHFEHASKKACNLRLQKLWSNGYLDRLFHPVVVTEGRTQRVPSAPVYQLTRLGARALTDSGQQLREAKTPSPLMLRHRLLLVDARVAVMAAAQRTLPGPPLYWSDGAGLRKTFRDALHAGRLVVPDAAFALPPMSSQAAPTAWLLEADRGTEPIERTGRGSSLAHKLQRYTEAHKRRELAEAARFQAVRVLFVVPSARRADRLLETVRDLAGPSCLFWVTCETAVAPGVPSGPTLRPERVLAPLWRCARHARWHALTEPARRKKGGEHP